MERTLAQDLVERLTSRKFLLTLLVIGLAVVGYLTGQLDYSQLVNVALWAAGIFSGAEGLADAGRALVTKPRTDPPTPPTTTTVNVDTHPPTDPNTLVVAR